MAARFERAANKHYRSSYSLESIVGCAAPARLASEAPLLHLFRKQFFFGDFCPTHVLLMLLAVRRGKKPLLRTTNRLPLLYLIVDDGLALWGDRNVHKTSPKTIQIIRFNGTQQLTKI